MAEEQNDNPPFDESDGLFRLLMGIQDSIDYNIARRLLRGTEETLIDSNEAFEAVLAQKICDYEQSEVSSETPRELAVEPFAQEGTISYPYEIYLPDNETVVLDRRTATNTSPLPSLPRIIDTIDLDSDDPLKTNANGELMQLSNFNRGIPLEERNPEKHENESAKADKTPEKEEIKIKRPLNFDCYCGRKYWSEFILNAHKLHIHGEGWNLYIHDDKTDLDQTSVHDSARDTTNISASASTSISGSVSASTTISESSQLHREDDNLSMQRKEVNPRFQIWSLEERVKKFFYSSLCNTQQNYTSTFDSDSGDPVAYNELSLKVRPSEELFEYGYVNMATNLLLQPENTEEPQAGPSNYNFHRSGSNLSRMRSFSHAMLRENYDESADVGDSPEQAGFKVPGFRCSVCGKHYSDERRLQIHIVEEHDDMKITYTCKTCYTQFTRKDDYETHCLKHNSGKNFKCSVCDEHFKCQKKRYIHEQEVHNITVDSILNSS